MSRWFRFQNDFWKASIDIEAQEAKKARELLNKLVGAPADWTLEMEITHMTINSKEFRRDMPVEVHGKTLGGLNNR